MKLRYKLTYKNGVEVIVGADNMLDLLNEIARCICDEAYVKFTDVYTFFDGYTHKTIKQNKYIHVLPSFIALLKSEYTIKKFETLSDEKDTIRIENFCNMFDKYRTNETIPGVMKDICKDGGYIVRFDEDGTETQIAIDLVLKYIDKYELSIGVDENDNTYFNLLIFKNELNDTSVITLYAVTPGFDCDRRSLYYSRIRNIMKNYMQENNVYIFNGLEFKLEEDKYAKDKYKFRYTDKDRYLTITFMEESIDALNYAGDIMLNGKMIFERKTINK